MQWFRGDTSYRSFPKVPIPCSPLFTLIPKPIKKTGKELWTNDLSDEGKGFQEVDKRLNNTVTRRQNIQ